MLLVQRFWIVSFCAGMFFINLSAQTITVTDEKGSRHPINWSLTGSAIYNNNMGNVGIGTTNPNNTLEVSTATAGNSGLRLSNLTNAPFLSTDANGDVINVNPLTGIIDGNGYLGFDAGGNLVTGTAGGGLSWSLLGNSDATASNFLGTTNDVKLSLVSNGTPMFEIGRRETLGLFDGSGTGLFPYNQANASVNYVRGLGGVSALEFESSGAAFYKPIFFTDTDGNFMMRGSSAETDFFELGSSGTANEGQLTFSIGDDGDEPIVFRKYNYNTLSFVEMMRLQGTGLDNTVRAGINVDGNTPNSTLQVTGSMSLAITTTTADLTLTDVHHTIILGGNHAITLPNANTCEGRVYVIKNENAFATVISNYLDNTGTALSTINARTILWLQSDGTNWQQLSNNPATNGPFYEKTVIWAEESGSLSNNSAQWSFGNGDTGAIGIPLPEDWEAYAVSFHADNTSNGSNTAEIAVVNIPSNNTVAELFRFTASGANDNLSYTEILASPVAIPAGTVLGFFTLNEVGNINGARVAVWLRRIP